MFIHLTAVAPRPVPILLSTDGIASVYPKDAEKPNGTTIIRLKPGFPTVAGRNDMLEVAESLAAIEAALEATDYEIVRPDRRSAPERGKLD